MAVVRTKETRPEKGRTERGQRTQEGGRVSCTRGASSKGPAPGSTTHIFRSVSEEEAGFQMYVAFDEEADLKLTP